MNEFFQTFKGQRALILYLHYFRAGNQHNLDIALAKITQKKKTTDEIQLLILIKLLPKGISMLKYYTITRCKLVSQTENLLIYHPKVSQRRKSHDRS